MRLWERVHGDWVHQRRVRKLTEHFAELVPSGARLLDVGCGDGLLSAQIAERRPDIEVTGLDVLVRPDAKIPVEQFDGVTIPYDDRSFDAVLLVDVLHHAEDPFALLAEAVRTARQSLLLKDHTRDGLLAEPTLRMMDDLANTRHGIRIPHNYWPRRRWLEAFASLGLSVHTWNADPQLYPAPASWVVGRSLHFIARLEVPAA